MSATLTPGPTIVGLRDPAARDPTLVGSKAAALAELAVDGFRVPAGFVLTTTACRDLQLAARDDAAGDALPIGLHRHLLRALAVLGDVPLAVRSSGVGEDLPGASFAGQYETVVGVRGIAAVTDAIRRCLAAADASRVASYRATMGIDAPAPMALLIQRLVEPDAAGVAFSANPVTGDRDEVLVSAVRGLGDRLVSGDVTPDEWRVRGSTAQAVAVTERAITADEALDIAQLARRVQAVRGTPQDVEWALTATTLYLIQARPITALPQPPRIVPPAEGFWTKDTEHYPVPLTPFGASTYLPAIEAAMPAVRDDFGLLVEGIRQISLGGEVYFRAVPPGGKDRPAPPWWVLAIAARTVPQLRRRARAADRALADDLAGQLVLRWQGEWRDAFLAEAATLRAVDLTVLDDAGLLRHLDRVLDLLRRGEVVHFRLWAAYTLAVHELVTLCVQLFHWPPEEALQLLTGSSGASAAPTRVLDELAEHVRVRPAARSILEAAGADVLDRLSEVDERVLARLTGYLEQYGHRPVGSYDPGAPTLAERPELLAALIRDRLRSPPNAQAGEVRGLQLARARRHLASRSPEDRARFDRAYTAAARAYPVREDNVLIVDGEPTGLLRYTALELGRRLARRRVLARADDAVWLEELELRAALQGAPHDARDTVARRRAEHAWVTAHPGPATYGADPGPPPDLRGLPSGLRHITAALLWTLELMAPDTRALPADAILSGLPGSPGTHTGPARIIRSEEGFWSLRPSDVLVCPTTSPVWSVLFGQAGALVTDHGGLLSHAAVIAREHHVPAVVATHVATERLRDGQVVTVDGTRGLVVDTGATRSPGRA